MNTRCFNVIQPKFGDDRVVTIYETEFPGQFAKSGAIEIMGCWDCETVLHDDRPDEVIFTPRPIN